MSMLRKTVISSLLAGVIALSGAGAAYAAASPAKQAAFESAKISATQAISHATAKVAGNATEVDFKFKNDKSFYKVDVVTAQNEKQKVLIDANSGEVLEVRADDHKDKHRDGAQPAAQPVKISLQQAIERAEGQTGGKVKEAELKTKKGTPRYVVETIANGTKQKTVIDAASGEIVNPNAG